MQREYLSIAVILTVAAGCDNVAWEGVELRLQPPTSPAILSAIESDISPDQIENDPSSRTPIRPILFSGQRTGSIATLTAVGEVAGNSLLGIPHANLKLETPDDFDLAGVTKDSEWILFSEGVRIGRMIAQDISIDERFCTPRPAISGIVELVSEAADVEQLIALPIAFSASRSFKQYVAHRHNYSQRVASLTLASEAIAEFGAEWPTSLLNSRADISTFQFIGESSQAIAATFVYQDQMTTSPPQEPGGYSLFLMGSESSGTYGATYLSYRPNESEGKGVPRYVDHIDWDGDGSEEILLEIFGSESRWFAGLAREEGRWTQSFEDSCNRSTVER